VLRFRFDIVDGKRVIDPTGHPVEDRNQAIAVAKRLAIDFAETRRSYLGKGDFISVVDKDGAEIHRESIDSAENSG
jgi:uncharacterized protein DUF6894